MTSSIEIFNSLHNLHQVFRRRMLDRLQQHYPALTFIEMRVLMLVGQQAGLSQTELSERSVLDKAQLTRTLASLERQGWIERPASPTDKRMRCLHLSPQGQTLVQQLMAWQAEVAEALLGDWPSSAVDILKAAVASVNR